MADFALKGTLDLNSRDFVRGADKAADAIEDTADALDDTNKAAEDTGKAFDKTAAKADALKKSLDLDTAASDLDNLGDRADGASRGMDRAATSAGDVAETSQRGIGPLRGFTDELGDGAAQGGIMGAAITDAGEAVQIYGKQVGISEKATARFATAAGVAGVAVLGLTVLYSKWAEARDRRDAFHTERIEAFTAAILEGADALETLSEAWQDAGTNIQAFGGAERLVLEQLNQLGISAFEATQIVEGGTEAVEAWRDEQELAGRDTKQFGLAYFFLKENAEQYAEAQADANAELEFYGTAAEQAADELKNFRGGLDRAVMDLEKFGETGEEAVTTVQLAFNTLKDEISLELELARAAEQFKRMAEGIGSDAEASRVDVLEMKQAVIEFGAAAENVPDEVITDLLAQIDEGAYRVVATRLDVLSRPRSMRIDVWTDTSRVDARYRHSGGPVNRSQPYLVGETGHEEMFVPQGAGRIISNPTTERIMQQANTMPPQVNFGAGAFTTAPQIAVYVDGVRRDARVAVREVQNHDRMRA